MKKVLILTSLVLLFVISCASTKVLPAEPVAEPAPVKTETIITADPNGLPYGEDLSASSYWRQVVCSPSSEARALELAGERNLVVLASDELVISSVLTGQFVVGILPVDAEVPENCMLPAAIK